MSIKVINDVWQHSQAKSGALLVLLAIADNANEQGIAWPSIKTVARKSRLSERQVQRLIRALQTAGELVIHEGGGPPGSTHTLRVSICHPSEERGDTGVTGGVTFEQGGVTPMSQRGDTHVTRTVIESSLEPSTKPSLIAGTQNDGVTWWKNRYERGKRG